VGIEPDENVWLEPAAGAAAAGFVFRDSFSRAWVQWHGGG
jgi:hypothetical protein